MLPTYYTTFEILYLSKNAPRLIRYVENDFFFFQFRYFFILFFCYRIRLQKLSCCLKLLEVMTEYYLFKDAINGYLHENNKFTIGK